MLNFAQKNPLVTISIVVLLMLLIHLDVPNITIMEARNFITARELLQNNDWLLTTMNGEARYQKPPLPTWLTALSGISFGIQSLFALRLPGVLMVLLLAFSLYFLSLKLKLSKIHSLHNSLILVTSFYVIAIINEAPWDIYTHAFMLTALYFLFQVLESDKVIWKQLIYSAFFVGCSIMSKGPVSLYALFLPFLISYGITFKFKNLKKKGLAFIVYIVLFLLVGSWWFVYVRIADADAFLKIASKETGNWSSYNVKPFYYYWSFFTQSGLWTIPAFISLLYPYLIKRVQYTKAYQFSFWWTIIAVVLLSLIPEKKPRYLMPVLIPLAINTGFYIQYLIETFSGLKNKKETIPVYFNFGLISTIAIAFPIAGYFVFNNSLDTFLVSYILTSVAVFSIGIAMLKKLIQKKIQSVFYLTIAFMMAIFIFGLPLSKSFNKNTEYQAINSLHSIEQNSGFKTYSVGEITPELLWDYNGYLKNIFLNNHLLIPSEEKFGLLILNKDVAFIKKELAPNYNLKHLKTYNLNVGSRKKERLIRQLYLVTKK